MLIDLSEDGDASSNEYTATQNVTVIYGISASKLIRSRVAMLLRQNGDELKPSIVLSLMYLSKKLLNEAHHLS